MEKEKLLQKYLDNELSPDEERQALHIFADDPEIRSLLRYEQKFLKTFRADPDSASFQVPEGFSERVMNRLEQEKAGGVSRASGKIKRIGKWFLAPRQVTWRPAYAAAIALFLAVAFSLPSEPDTGTLPRQNTSMESVQTVAESSDRVLLRFIFIDSEADSVEVAGDFNNWEPIALSRNMVNGEQIWTGMVEVSRGQHQYMFIRNGDEWVTDPLAPVQQDDGFGNKNAVIFL